MRLQAQVSACTRKRATAHVLGACCSNIIDKSPCKQPRWVGSHAAHQISNFTVSPLATRVECDMKAAPMVTLELGSKAPRT